MPLWTTVCVGMEPGPTLYANHTGKVGIVYNGGQHAREWISPMTNAYIANQLVTLYGKVSVCCVVCTCTCERNEALRDSCATSLIPNGVGRRSDKDGG
jgi:hypothetical protein